MLFHCKGENVTSKICNTELGPDAARTHVRWIVGVSAACTRGMLYGWIASCPANNSSRRICRSRFQVPTHSDERTALPDWAMQATRTVRSASLSTSLISTTDRQHGGTHSTSLDAFVPPWLLFGSALTPLICRAYIYTEALF